MINLHKKYGTEPESKLRPLDLQSETYLQSDTLPNELCDPANIVLTSYFYVQLLSNFYHFSLQHSSCQHVFSVKVENSVDPDQMASSEVS